MEERGKIKLRNIYNIAFALLTVAVGLVIISQLWGIFRSAPEKAFSRASVGDRLIAISPVLAVWILGLIGNSILSAITPKPALALKGGLSDALALRSMQKRFKQGGKEVAGVKKLRLARLCAALIGGAAIVALFLLSVSYLFDEHYVIKNSAHIFSSHRGAADRLVSAAPWLFLALLVGFLIITVYERARKREIALLKGAFADEIKKKKSGKTSLLLYEKGIDEEYLTLSEKWEKFVQNKAKAFEIGRLAIRIGLFVAAVVLIILGINWGGMDLVFEKARSICQQCIGLG